MAKQVRELRCRRALRFSERNSSLAVGKVMDCGLTFPKGSFGQEALRLRTGFCEAENPKAAEGDELIAELEDERLRAALATGPSESGQDCRRTRGVGTTASAVMWPHEALSPRSCTCPIRFESGSAILAA
jgi:hypothetical protein